MEYKAKEDITITKSNGEVISTIKKRANNKSLPIRGNIKNDK